jgi:hypothetical protein
MVCASISISILTDGVPTTSIVYEFFCKLTIDVRYVLAGSRVAIITQMRLIIMASWYSTW